MDLLLLPYFFPYWIYKVRDIELKNEKFLSDPNQEKVNALNYLMFTTLVIILKT